MLTTREIQKLASSTKRLVLKNDGRIYLVRTDGTEQIGKVVFTVWNPEDNFIFVHTTSEAEAEEYYKKYAV